MALTTGSGTYLRDREERNKKFNSCVIASRRHLLHLLGCSADEGGRGALRPRESGWRTWGLRKSKSGPECCYYKTRSVSGCKL
jgi:hypothetical protein